MTKKIKIKEKKPKAESTKKEKKRKIKTKGDLWEPLIVNRKEIEDAFEYATVTLPWTFDRMMYGPRTQKSVNRRLMNIFIGVLNQNMLERILTEKGYKCAKDWKNYRDSDTFDFKIDGRKFDVKTTILFSEYDLQQKREPFSIDLLLKYKDYSDREWRNFFPMMVPISQLSVDKMKDSYIFGIAQTNFDLKKITPTEGDKGYWCAAPFGKKPNSFFQNTAVIKKREEQKSGFKVKIKWKRHQNSLDIEKSKSEVIVFGEWNKKKKVEHLEISEGKETITNKEFSSLCVIQFLDPDLLINGELIITVENNFKDFVPHYRDPLRNLNNEDFEWHLNHQSFVNLRIPDDYKIYWIGHISFNDFANNFQNYPSFFIPRGDNMNLNQFGRINTKLRKKFQAIDNRRKKSIKKGIPIPWPEFSNFIQGSEIHGGILIAANNPSGRALGAACYYYPPYALQETAIYVLVSDLSPMETI